MLCRACKSLDKVQRIANQILELDERELEELNNNIAVAELKIVKEVIRL